MTTMSIHILNEPVYQRVKAGALSRAQAISTLAYYADYTAETEAEIAEREHTADAAEAAWTRERVLLET